MTFTPAFLRAASSGKGSPRLLVTITLTDPAALTLRMSYKDLGVNGVAYRGVIADTEAIEEEGEWLAQSYEQCSWSFEVLDLWMPGQAPTDSFAVLLSQYRFRGAAITAQQWDPETDTTDAGTMFTGEINGYEAVRGRITFTCVQRKDWNKRLDPVRCERYLFPRAPEKSIGRVIPALIGRGSGQDLRGDYARAKGQSRNNFDHHGGGIPTVRGLLVDMGRGNPTVSTFEKGKVLVASHGLSSIGQGSNGTNFFVTNDLTYPSVVNPAGGDILNAAAGSGFLIPNQAGMYFVPVTAAEVKDTGANIADNPRGVLDPSNESSFAFISKTAGQYGLTLNMPDVPPQGRVVDLWILFGYKTNAAVGDIRFTANNPGRAASQLYAPLASTTLVEAFQIGAGVWPTPDPWALSQLEISWGFQVPANAGNNGVTMRCHMLGVIVQYQRRDLTGQAGFWLPEGWIRGIGGSVFVEPMLGNRRAHLPGVKRNSAVNIQDFSGEYFCNADGPLDDGAGTFTGVAASLIAKAPGIAHYLLTTYCAQGAGQIETGVGALGSFVDARALLTTWNKRPMENFLAIDTEMQTRDALEQLAKDSVSVVHIGRTDGKFRWTPFVTAPAVTFPRTIEPEDVIDLELLRLRTMPDESLLNSVRLNYLFDAFREVYVGEAFASGLASHAGYLYSGLRDESIEVVAGQSDRLDIITSAGTVAALLTVGKYDPWAFAKHCTTQINAVAVPDFLVHYGPRFEALYNDKIDFNDGAVKALTVAPLAFASFEDACASIQAGMNAISSNWTVTYNRATRKVTIDRTAGTKTLLGRTGVNASSSALGALGIDNSSAAGPRTSDHEVEEERFVVACCTHTGFLMPIETGANGTNATPPRTAGALLGFPLDRDTFANTVNSSSFVGLCPKNTREYLLATVEARYGARRPYTNTARTILDTDTARECRNRLIDLGAAPRPLISFRSYRIRDMERYHVVQFSSRFDRFIRYTEDGTDGSWAGKKFWAVNLRHKVGPDLWDSEALLVRA